MFYIYIYIYVERNADWVVFGMVRGDVDDRPGGVGGLCGRRRRRRRDSRLCLHTKYTTVVLNAPGEEAGGNGYLWGELRV